jgi:hypothetical protein
MQRLDSADIVGLCNDELYRRYCVFPGVYSAPHDDEACCRELHGDSNESDPEKLARLHMGHEEGTALYHACEAQYFHSQLPLSENADCCDAGLDFGSKQQQQQQQQKRDYDSNRRKKTYISKEFAQLGSTEACSSLRAIKKKLNECHEDEEGFFYIVQLRTERLSGDVEIVLDEYRNKIENESVSGGEENKENVEKVNESDNTKKEDKDDEEDDDGNINEEFVRINGTINVEAITKIWIARRAGAYGMSGKFTCVEPPMISIDDF